MGNYTTGTGTTIQSFVDTNGNFVAVSDPLAKSSTTGGTYASGINNEGQIVGYYVDSTGTDQGFVDTNGTFTAVTDPSATSGSTGGTMALDINDSGVVEGKFDNGTDTVAQQFSRRPCRNLPAWLYSVPACLACS